MTAKVLVCDDEAHIVRAVEFKLRRAGLAVVTARDGQEAWEHVQQDVPDLIVSDCQMPRMNGLELLERLRSWEPSAQVPVIMLTGKGYELPVAQLRERLGVAAVLSKPFSPRELEAKVLQLLRQTTPATPS